MRLALRVLPGTYGVCRFGADAPLPEWLSYPPDSLTSVSRTPDELSIICLDRLIPPTEFRTDGWRCLRISGSTDPGLPGIVASAVEPLAAAGVSVFVTATYDTDYLLVDRLGVARRALLDHGHRFED